MKPPVDIKILPASYEECPILAKFFNKYFFPDEPLNSALNRNIPVDEMPFMELLKQGLSLKAVNVLEKSEDNIVGVVINEEVSLAKKKNLNDIKDPKTFKIRKILTDLDEKSKVWEVVHNENHFSVLCVAVNKEYRGHKIGKKLVEESLKLAKSANYKYASIECTSYYSAKFAVELGFELLAEIPYDEYRDENNRQIFKISHPHKSLKKFIKRL